MLSITIPYPLPDLKDAKGMGRHGWFLPATGVLATILQLKPETLTASIINDSIIIMVVVAVLIHVVSSAFEEMLEAGHFKSIAAGTGRLARALAFTLLLIICVPKIWWFLLSAWVLFFIWVTYTLREELSKLCESIYNAVPVRGHGQAQEPNEVPVRGHGQAQEPNEVPVRGQGQAQDPNEVPVRGHGHEPNEFPVRDELPV